MARCSAIAVPEFSQMVYPDGGPVWCSPTSVSMVLAYWLRETGPCEPRVRAAVAGVYDWLYDGHGNWPFNTAYASSRGSRPLSAGSRAWRRRSAGWMPECPW